MKLTQRKRGSAKTWYKLTEFQTATAAHLFMKDENIWKKASCKRNLDGERIEFRCKYGQFRVNECPAERYLLYHASNEGVSLYATEEEHHHNNVNVRGLDEETKARVLNLFNNGITKPNAIIASFRKDDLPEPSKSKLISYLQTVRNNLYGPCAISGNDLNAWCAERNYLPDDNDQSFILNYIIDCNSEDVEEQTIRLVMSTKRLLENMTKSDLIQIDATYKLIWQGYPVMVIGSTDKSKTFHPYAIAVCQRETEEDFCFIFNSLKMYNQNWDPQILLSDASSAITGGFNRAFGIPKQRLMCYFHVVQSIEKRLKSMEQGAVIKRDISMLQLCKSEKVFKKSVQLFMDKWSEVDNKKINEFLVYFLKEWIEKNDKWYEGAALGYPSTNNGIEATNAWIKREHTLRERLPVGHFLGNVSNLLYKWSKDRDEQVPNYKEFRLKETISLNDWTESYQWAQKNKNILKFQNRFYTSSSNATSETITNEQLLQYSENTWDTFDDFKNNYFGIWEIEEKSDEYNCSCPAYLKNYKCKHTLGLQIRLKQIDVPQEAKIIPLGQKRKRGRPAKAKPALLMQ